MSNYRNFIQDFPTRCEEILTDYKDRACKNGREVTHMFAIASAAITIPFARLIEGKHPSRDKKNCQQAASKFANLCDKYFLSSSLWGTSTKSWKSGLVKKDDIERDKEYWITNALSLRDDIKVLEVLNIIRNALAHGSIFTLPKNDDQIENIILLSKEKIGKKFTGDFNLLMVSAEDFNKLLVKWIDFLNNLKIPSEVN
jgi:hypothetical protein